MKSSLKKLRGLATNHRSDTKDKRNSNNQHYNPSQIDELSRAFQDMEDMQNFYDSLYNAAAATANSAYEFSQTIREMGTCLLEKTAMNDGEESGRVLLMLGKVQFELYKLVDSYRSHIVQTITTPSESLLNELRTVEEMKRQCDDKRDLLHRMMAAQKDKSKSKNHKGETFTPQQIQAAQKEYDEEATLFVFRLKSLKQGQSRSLLTQAARHHAAQLTFFRKGSKSLEAIEPHVKLVAEQQHIDYQFSGLEDDGTDDDCSSDPNDDGELSFDYGQNEQNPAVSSARNSMELDQMEHASGPVSSQETSQENLEKIQGDLFFASKGTRHSSQSAPIFPENKFDQSEKLEFHPPSARKFHTYVLPTPLDCKNSNSVFTRSVPVPRRLSMSGLPTQSWHSSSLVLDDSRDTHGLIHAQSLNSKSVLKESNSNSETRIPPPLADGLSIPRFDKKIKRQAFSGPLTSKGQSGKHFFPVLQEHTPKISAAPIHTSIPSTSPKISATTPLMPSPKISELHELPRPPLSSVRPTRPPSLIGHSAPLFSRGPRHSISAKILSGSSQTASPLPMPPATMSRSFSIPSRDQRMTSLKVGRSLEAHNSDMAEEVSSMSLMPISLAPRASESDYQAAKSKGGELG